ncbi:MAG: alpha/beta fold hydrolase [Micropruina sp.]|nr:alpha/beta fold hydrolase [Micropruina sp.]
MPGLHTILVGKGRPYYVFLHGLFGRGKNWAGIARAVFDANGDASVLFDLPNHGNSLWTTHFDYVEMADLIAAELRTKLGSAPQVTLVGHSMGGKVAMLVALRHPDVVKGLVVIDIAPAESRQIVTSIPLASAMLNLDLNAFKHRSERRVR